MLLTGALGLWMVTALLSPLRSGNPRWRSVALSIGALAMLAAAAPGLHQAPVDLTLFPFSFGTTAAVLHVDALASWFLLVVGLATIPLGLYLPGYLDHLPARVDRRQIWMALPLLVASMAVVVLAANVPTFLVGWEVMALSSFALVAADHTQGQARRGSLIYLGATRLSSALLMAAFIWAHAITGSWTFSQWHVTAAAPAVLLLVGLGVKAGMWPFHLWLPAAHPVAPAPVSALMSGVMVKIAIYAIIRFYVLTPAFSHPLIATLLLVLGAVSAFWGVAFTLLQHDLKRLLAYSTVENVGLILLGIGGGLCGVRLALVAALFHTLNHAMFKSLLFLGAGAVDHACGTRDLEYLGGLGRRMPLTFACFLVGSAAICALPPLNGFASEWLLYQGGLHLAWSSPTAGGRLEALLGIGLLSLVGAMALASFVKACGVTFLGVPRSAPAEGAQEVSSGMQVAQVLLAVICVALGVLAPALVSPFPSLLPLLMVGALTAAAAVAWARRPARRYVTWDCGFGPLPARAETTATSFVQPIARMFGALYRYRLDLHIEGRLFPDRITVEPRTESLLEQRLYKPLWHLVETLAERLLRLQTGSIHLYLLTMFVTLLILLYVGGHGL